MDINILSLVLSITGLIASIIFGTFIFSLHKTTVEIKIAQEELRKTKDDFLEMQVALIGVEKYALFQDNGPTLYLRVTGRELVDWIKKKYCINDDTQALKTFHSLVDTDVYEQYASEHLEKLKKEKQL